MAERPATGDARALEADVLRAQSGDRDALERVVRAVQGDVLSLAMRFLWHPQDAEDAAQEILIRVVTGLAGFRSDSGFRTWVYRIACNRLLTLRKQRMEQASMSFEEFGEDLAQGLSDAPLQVEPGFDEALMLEEVKIGCTLAMLMCLDRDSRLAYILGDIVEIDHREAASVMQIAPAAFRKRLSRARASVVAFMTSRCGLVNPANACRCRRRVNTALAAGRVDPGNLLFATSLTTAKRFPGVLARIRELEEVRRVAALYKSHPGPAMSDSFASWLTELISEQG